MPAESWAVIGALIAGLATLYVSRRQFSGKIESSEAHDLWEEASKIRQEYRDTNREQAIRIEFLEKALDKALEDNQKCRERIAVLEARLSEKGILDDPVQGS